MATSRLVSASLLIPAVVMDWMVGMTTAINVCSRL
jgi:hypothetical protein